MPVAAIERERLARRRSARRPRRRRRSRASRRGPSTGRARARTAPRRARRRRGPSASASAAFARGGADAAVREDGALRAARGARGEEDHGRVGGSRPLDDLAASARRSELGSGSSDDDATGEVDASRRSLDLARREQHVERHDDRARAAARRSSAATNAGAFGSTIATRSPARRRGARARPPRPRTSSASSPYETAPPSITSAAASACAAGVGEDAGEVRVHARRNNRRLSDTMRWRSASALVECRRPDFAAERRGDPAAADQLRGRAARARRPRGDQRARPPVRADDAPVHDAERARPARRALERAARAPLVHDAAVDERGDRGARAQGPDRAEPAPEPPARPAGAADGDGREGARGVRRGGRRDGGGDARASSTPASATRSTTVSCLRCAHCTPAFPST